MPLATPILASLRAPDGATRDKPCEYVSLTMSRYFCLPGPVPSRRLHLGPPPVGSATRTRPHCDTTTLFTVIHNHCKVVSFSCPRELGAKCGDMPFCNRNEAKMFSRRCRVLRMREAPRSRRARSAACRTNSSKIDLWHHLKNYVKSFH